MILAPLVLTLICANAAKIAAAKKSIFYTTVHHPNTKHEDDKDFKSFFKNQTKLVDHLLEDYNRNIPATYTRDRYGDKPKPSLANISLYYMKLLSIDEPKQASQMIIDVILTWVDPRLSWDPEEFDGIKEFVIGRKETVWLPDILPYDIISYSESIPEDRLLLNVFSNGTVSYYSTAVIEFICHLRLTNFPFDEQKCEFRMTSFNAPTTELNVTGSISPEINDPSSVGNGEWQFRGVFVENDWYEGPSGRGYSLVIFHLEFRRSTTYYFMLVIIPSFILTILCLSGLFWRSIEKDCYMENLNLGLTAILAMMLVMEISTENMPKIDEFNKLSRYSMINLGLITLAILLNMILGKLHVYRETKTLKKELESMNKKPRLLQLKYLFMKRLHIFFLILFNFVETLDEFLAAEAKLFKHIFKDYDLELPATYTRVRYDPTVEPKVQKINITLMYSNLLNIDEPGETISVIIDTYLEWMDHRLRWNPADFDGIELIMTTRNRVWTPDIVAYDTIDKEMVLVPSFDPSYNVGVMSSNSWTAIGKDIWYLKYHEDLHNWTYSEVNFVFKLRRSDTYYVVLIIIPSYVLVFLCLAGLFWSKITCNNYMEKLNLGYAGILAMVLILQITTQEMPRTNQLPILSLYVLLNLFALTLSCLAVLITGKAEGKMMKSTKSVTGWSYRVLKKIHIVYMVFFLSVITINLIFLCSKKGSDRNSKIKNED